MGATRGEVGGTAAAARPASRAGAGTSAPAAHWGSAAAAVHVRAGILDAQDGAMTIK
jgi:hypothetical protein